MVEEATVAEQTLLLDYDFTDSVGSNSLVGAIAHKFGGIPDRVTLVFPQPSAAWLSKNEGPHLSLAASHVVPCLLEDVLLLQAGGCTVIIKTVIQDPPA